MYGLNGRNEIVEMKKRYNAMVNVFSDILSCGRWEIEELFDSQNNIEVGDIIARYTEDMGEFPDRNTVYREAMIEFATNNNLEVGKDIDIYTNGCLDTHIYLREELIADYGENLQDIFNMNVEILA